MTEFSKADIALGYAIYDSEHTSRLGEQGTAVQSHYFKRAKRLIHAMEYRAKAEIDAIIKEIRK